jgi:hypothetical protein
MGSSCSEEPLMLLLSVLSLKTTRASMSVSVVRHIFVTVGSILLNCFGLEFLLPEILQLKPAGMVLRQAKEYW